MASADELAGLAAEYALGTLTSTERADAEARAASDARFRAMIDDWERRLSPLALALEPVEAPPHVRGRVMKLIAGDAPNSETVARLKRSVSIWQGLTAVAASAAALMFIFQPAKPPEGQRFVSVLQSEGPGPAFIASVDLAKGTITVRAVEAKVPAGKSYELWAVGGGRDKPQSLGVIDASFKVPASKLGGKVGDTVFAVSLEPQGGSPTGQPTGPVLFTGKLVEAE
jgi:anti-sigma-K factor RskA